jgi:tetratricopeptide (TPR) repeat protein
MLKFFTLISLFLLFSSNLFAEPAPFDQQANKTLSNITSNQIAAIKDTKLELDKFSAEQTKTNTELINKIENTQQIFLQNQTNLKNEFEKKVAEIEKNSERTLGTIDWLFKLFAILFALIGILGFRSFIDTISASTNLKKYVDDVMKGYQQIREDIKERQFQLKEHAGFETRSPQNPLNQIENAEFLDYEHRLYFMLTNLPISQDLGLYKESLYKIGTYWWWREDFGRAILRFEEVEKIHRKMMNSEEGLLKQIATCIAGVLSKTNISPFKNNRDILILGNKSHYFYNFYGNACWSYAEKCTDQNEKNNFVCRAEAYYNTSKEIHPLFSKPYYNLGLLYVLEKKEPLKGLEFYQQALGKTPNLDSAIRRNMACALKRLNKPISEIITVLDPIKENDPYWNSIFTDEILKVMAGTKEWDNFAKKKLIST